MARLPSKGRGKTQQTRIENERERAVTFSKRCSGLFKKASEISTLCGVQIAIIMFSLSGKPVSFGSPSVGSVVKKFLNSNDQADQDDDLVTRYLNSYSYSKLQDLLEKYNDVNERLVMEKKRGQMLEEQTKELLGGKLYEEYLDSLGLDRLMQLKHKLEDLKITLEGKLDQESSSSLPKEADLSKIGGPKDYLKL